MDTTRSSVTSAPLSDGANWYFHIRTMDHAGNWNGGAVHVGPYRIHTTAPSNPTTATETHGAGNNTWQRTVSDPAFTWSGASDGSGSGIAGYYVYWGTNPSGTSSTWRTSASYDPGAVTSPSVYYLRVQTKDNAGNTSGWQTLFTFRYAPDGASDLDTLNQTLINAINDALAPLGVTLTRLPASPAAAPGCCWRISSSARRMFWRWINSLSEISTC